MRARRRVALAVVLVAALARSTAAEPIYHIKSPSTLKTEKGSELQLPPGYFLDEKTWQERDLELKRAQEARTRLTAENESLRKSAGELGSVRFYVVTFAVGALAGVVAYQTLK